MWPARRVVYRSELTFSPRTLGREQTEGIVFSCELLSQVTYFFSPYPSHSPNSGHKKVVVNFACLLWVKFIKCQNSQNVLSGFPPFSVMDPSLVDCYILYFRVFLPNSQFLLFLQVVRKSLLPFPSSSLFLAPLWSR